MLFVIAASFLMAFVLLWSLNCITKKNPSTYTEKTETQRLAVDYPDPISKPEASSTGCPKQRPVVETKVSDMMEVVTGSSAAFIRKVDERNEAVLKTQELSSKLTKLEDQLTSSNLKLQELQNVHEEFVHRHEIELENKQRMICELEEKYLRLKHNESSLRRIIDDKDRLLQSKETEYVVKIDRQNKTIGHLLDQLIDMDRIKEESLKKLAAAEVKPDTRDVGCGSDEPIIPICEIKEPQSDNEIPTTVSESVIEPASLPETKVLPIGPDGPSFVTKESPSQPEVVGPSEATASGLPLTEFVVRSAIMCKSTENAISVIGIPTEQIGFVIGYRGRNILRLERGYGVKLSFVKGTLQITGGDEIRRQAVCKDVVENLPVVIECPLLPLGNQNRISDFLLNGLGFKYDVKIGRPSAHDKIGTISGRIDRCRTVYHLLKNASLSR